MMDLKSYFGDLSKQQTNEVAYLVVLNLREGLDPSTLTDLSAAPDRPASLLASTIVKAIERDEGTAVNELSIPARHRYIEELGNLSREKTLDGVSKDLLDQAETQLNAFRAM